MNRFSLSLLLIFLLLFAFSQQKVTNRTGYLKKYLAADNLYHQAGELSSQANYTAKTEELEKAMNRRTLALFIALLPDIEKAGDDSLAFHCYYRIGILWHYFDSLDAAKLAYTKAIGLRSKLPSLPDSFLFKLHLFVGGIEYSNNQFDSALINYKQAELIAGEYKLPLDGTSRLYNTLGAMYYETGNFSQAKNYFEKAIDLLSPNEPAYKGLLVNYKINLAATLTRLEEFQAANTIYQDILPGSVNTNDILHNIGTINSKLGNPLKAIGYYKQVVYANNRNVRLLNDIGQAYTSLNQFDSAKYYYQRAIAENQKWNGQQKNVQAGLTLKYLGDQLVNENKLPQALDYYQQSLQQFTSTFNETDINKNPSRFNEVFSYINLFNALVAKADAMALLYTQQKDIKWLETSLNTYRSAFSLADHVERTYDSDEARLFLNKIKYTAHSKPIDVSLQLYDLTQKRIYLEEAYLFDQRNKASILSLNIQANGLRKINKEDSEFYRRQDSLRTAITRFSLKAAGITDSLQLKNINDAVRDDEIELGKVQEMLNNVVPDREKQFTDRIPAVNDLQKDLDNTTALLSYHLSDKELLVLLVTGNKFEYRLTPIGPGFFEKLDSFKMTLHNVTAEQKYQGDDLSASLYRILIKPVASFLPNIKRLIIIPDDELNYLPFEALEDENNIFLVEKYAVQYQFSTALLGKEDHAKKEKGILAFAPFASKGYRDTTGTLLGALPASREEISQLKGNILIDSAADKNNFLQNAGHYGIIHLATHASVNNESPLRSFIAFYPGKDDYKLYAQEIYNLQLDSTELVILSACETGTGQLVKGEGLMSLSRAFAYAGCSNIITSLWKAEDISTSFIMQRLHYYLDKNYTKDKALQQAKLDLLNDKEIDPRFKTPNYWAHLLFIGNYEQKHNSSNWWWISIAIITGAILYMLVNRKRMPK